MDSGLYDFYCTLRNRLRQTEITDSLYVIWAWSQLHQIDNFIMPSDIENPHNLQSHDDLTFREQVHTWELSILAREIILHAHPKVGNKSLKTWSFFSETLNKLKAMEGYISAKYITVGNVQNELVRLFHHQFIWDILKPHKVNILRYYKIFSHALVNPLVQNIYGLTTEEIYGYSMMFYGGAVSRPSYRIDKSALNGKIYYEKLSILLDKFAVNVEDFKSLAKDSTYFDERFYYSFNPLLQHPLIKVRRDEIDYTVCPIPTVLFWRFTRGLFYDICDSDGFDKAFGKSFEEYTGSVISQLIKKCVVFPEQQYTKEKKSVDYLLIGDALLFIECKARRMSKGALENFISDEVAIYEISKLLPMAVQAYKQIHEYKTGQYNFVEFQDKPIYPMIVTLEDWLVFGNLMVDTLEKMLRDELPKKGIPLEYLDTYPITTCSIHELENCLSIMEKVGFNKFMSNKVFDREHKYWLLGNYSESVYKDLYVDIELFPGEFEKVFDNIITTLRA